MRDKEYNTPFLGKKFDRIEQDAVRWFTRINHGDNDPAVVKRFYQWLEKSQEHRAKYDAICTVMDEAREFTDDPLLKAFYQSITIKTSDSFSIKKRITEMFTTWWHAGSVRGVAAAALTLVLMVVFFQFQNFGPQDKLYQTGIGEIKVITLDDNSVIKLNTRTVLTVNYSNLRRSIILNKGQATFSVAKDPERPFVVSTGMGQVVALGTEFDILKTHDQIQINLIEGEVRVTKAPSKQGGTNKGYDIMMEAHSMRASYVVINVNGISQVEERDPIYATAWQQHKIVFDDKPLSYVINELNRYSSRPIILGDASRKDELITAIFPTDVPAALVLIKKYFNLVEEANNKEKIVLIPYKNTTI